MASYTIYSSTGDIAVRVSNSNFATARAASSGTTSGTTSTYLSVGDEGVPYNFYIGFFMFDTSVIASSETITAATMGLSLVGDNAGTAANQYTICQSTQATWNSIVGDDFDQRGSLEMATRINRKVSTETGYETFTFTSTGRGQIARSGETKPASASASGKSQFTLMYAKDLDNSAPATNDYNQVYLADEAGTTRDPKLEVTTSSSIAYDIVAALGTFTLTGIDAAFKIAHTIVADLGTFVLTGFDAILYGGKTLGAEVGAFVLTGFDATFNKTLSMAADLGQFILTGIDVAFNKAITLALDVGTFTLTGFDALLQAGRSMAADVGEFVLTGVDVLFRKGITILAETGSFILTGFAIRFPIIWSTLTKNVVALANSAKNAVSWVNQDKTND